MSTQKKTVAFPSATASPSTTGRFFHITERGSSIAQKVRDGFATFFAVAYILVVNPIILSTALPVETGFAFADITVGTALVADIVTILMGLVTNFPLAFAAGMNLDAVVVFILVGGSGPSYQEVMGLIVWGDILITIPILTGFREAAFKAAPCQLKTVVSVGVGLFIAFVGLVNAGVIRSGGIPARLGINGSFTGLPALVLVFGLLLAVVLYIHKVRGAILIDLLFLIIFAVIF